MRFNENGFSMALFVSGAPELPRPSQAHDLDPPWPLDAYLPNSRVWCYDDPGAGGFGEDALADSQPAYLSAPGDLPGGAPGFAAYPEASWDCYWHLLDWSLAPDPALRPKRRKRADRRMRTITTLQNMLQSPVPEVARQVSQRELGGSTPHASGSGIHTYPATEKYTYPLDEELFDDGRGSRCGGSPAADWTTAVVADGDCSPDTGMTGRPSATGKRPRSQKVVPELVQEWPCRAGGAPCRRTVDRSHEKCIARTAD